MAGRNLAGDWAPFLQGVAGLEGLARLWARAITIQIGRMVSTREVVLHIHQTDPAVTADAGLRPAVLRWLAVPPTHRFVPPGIRPDRVDRRDIEMWLKVGSLCERNTSRGLRADLFDE